MRIQQELITCQEIVEQYRAELDPIWPRPDIQDSLLFAYTELGEAVDADLRNNETYQRNREKNNDVLDELADCAIMLLTALGDSFDIAKLPEEATRVAAQTWDVYAMMMAHVLWIGAYSDAFKNLSAVEEHEREAYFVEMTLSLLALIALRRGMKLSTRIEARLERIKTKRLAERAALAV